jgi:hypothetical protein
MINILKKGVITGIVFSVFGYVPILQIIAFIPFDIILITAGSADKAKFYKSMEGLYAVPTLLGVTCIFVFFTIFAIIAISIRRIITKPAQ